MTRSCQDGVAVVISPGREHALNLVARRGDSRDTGEFSVRSGFDAAGARQAGPTVRSAENAATNADPVGRAWQGEW